MSTLDDARELALAHPGTVELRELLTDAWLARARQRLRAQGPP